jgi:hypothetical protein
MAQSLIEQLQLGAVDGAAPITDLLRRAKLAAVKLSAAEFAAWVDLEMNGYRDTDEVPPYRRLVGPVRFFNPFHGWQPIFGMENMNRKVFQPIAEVSTLSQMKSGMVTIGVPAKIREMVARQVEFQCEVRQHISTTAMLGIVEAVRNNVLEWTIKLEKAGIRGDGLSFSPEETKVAQSMFVTNNYHGPVASVAHGSNTIHNISQTNASATPQEIADAVGALIKAIQAEGALPAKSADAVADLAAAEPELKGGRVPFGKLGKALEVLNKSEDIAMRAPEVMSRLHAIGQMLGLM